MSQSSAEVLTVHAAMLTHIGRQRKQNQDAIGQLVPTDPQQLAQWGQIYVLADGVGGLPGGDLASQYAVSEILNRYYDEEYAEPDLAKRLARAIVEANAVIYAEGQEQEPPVTMATTVVAAVIQDNNLIIGSVGDSPAYLLREGEIRQLNRDHNVETLGRGDGTPVSADDPDAHRLVRALGRDATVKVEVATGRVRDGDYIVLCSDGLTRYMEPEEIGATVIELPIQSAVTALVETANARGGADNVSVIILELLDEEASLLRVRDPMEEWGTPRRAERQRAAAPESAYPAVPGTEPAFGPLLQQAWDFVRSNTVLTGAGLGVLLILFGIIMVAISSVGNDNARRAEPTRPPDPTALAATAAAAFRLTDEANLAATSAEIARQTLTPPTATPTPSPIPTGGPQMENGVWFRVEPGDPIRTFSDPALGGQERTPLEAGSTYRVTVVNRDAPSGPWYQVIDNLGQEARWVNGPSLHQRIVVVDTSGIPLPDALQPIDVPPPGTPWNSPTPPIEPSPALSVTPPADTPSTPAPAGALGPTETPSITPTIGYVVEVWGVGRQVRLALDLDLCRTPAITSCDAGRASAGETGVITGGPVPNGEHWWWEVELSDGRAGWIAQVLLTAR